MLVTGDTSTLCRPDFLCSDSHVICDTKTPDQWIPVVFNLGLQPRHDVRRRAVAAA